MNVSTRSIYHALALTLSFSTVRSLLALFSLLLQGPNTHPLVALGKASFPGETGWNFADKYIFDKTGSVVARTKGTSDTLDEFMPLLDAPSTTAPAPEAPEEPAIKKAKPEKALPAIAIQWCGG